MLPSVSKRLNSCVTGRYRWHGEPKAYSQQSTRCPASPVRLSRHCCVQVWEHVCGDDGKVSPLTCASSSPMKAKHHGVEVLVVVYECLREVMSGILETGHFRGLPVSIVILSKSLFTRTRTVRICWNCFRKHFLRK